MAQDRLTELAISCERCRRSDTITLDLSWMGRIMTNFSTSHMARCVTFAVQEYAIGEILHIFS